jgi:pimeloyl-ACP methyl ester carboxylesterase
VPYIDFIKSYASTVTIKKFENTGHYITLEKPEIINDMIAKWIKSI